MRAATFTASPIAVYSWRRDGPIQPGTLGWNATIIEEDADGLDAKEVDLPRPPQSLVGERLPVRVRGGIGGVRRSSLV